MNGKRERTIRMRNERKESMNLFDILLIGTLVTLVFLAAIQAGSGMMADKTIHAPANIAATYNETTPMSAVRQGESPKPERSLLMSEKASQVREIPQSQSEVASHPAAQPSAFAPRKDIPLSAKLQEFVTEKCAQEQIDTNLVYAIMWHETRFQPDAISKTQDYGLMQINKPAHFAELQERYGISDMREMLEPYKNAEYGIELIASLIHEHGVKNGLAAYKCGEAGMRANLRRGYTPVDVADMMEKANEYRAAQIA